jgi:hypothetical protein
MRYEQPDLWSGPAPERERRPDEPPFGARIEALGLMDWLRHHGHSIQLKDDGGIRVSPPPPQDIVDRLKASKQALVEVLRRRT